jgi:hypothetical protein
MRNSYHVGDKVLFRGRVCVVKARFDRILFTRHTFPCHVPLRSYAYRLKYVTPQHDNHIPHGKGLFIAFGDELTLLPPRKRGIRRTSDNTDFGIL